MCRRLLAGLGVLLLSQAAVDGQTPANPHPGEPDFTVVVEGTFDPDTVREFLRRVHEYDALRREMEMGLPPLQVTPDPDETEAFERRLTDRIEDARRARRGQIFLPSMAGQLKRMLSLRIDPITLALIMEDGPPEFDVDVNERYPRNLALATMPPNILLRLPELPPDLEYRFVGRHFILRDVRANMVVDEIPYVLECRDCVPAGHDDHHDADADADLPDQPRP